jgi:hypothetical protein
MQMGDKDWEGVWDAILEAKNLAYIKKLDEDSMQHQRRLAEIGRKNEFDIRAARAKGKRQEEAMLVE